MQLDLFQDNFIPYSWGEWRPSLGALVQVSSLAYGFDVVAQTHRCYNGGQVGCIVKQEGNRILVHFPKHRSFKYIVDEWFEFTMKPPIEYGPVTMWGFDEIKYRAENDFILPKR